MRELDPNCQTGLLKNKIITEFKRDVHEIQLCLTPAGCLHGGKENLGFLKSGPVTVGLSFGSFPWRVDTVTSHRAPRRISQVSQVPNLAVRSLGSQQRERTEETHAACVGAEKKNKTTTKTGSVLLVAHKSGGACTVFPPPPFPPLIPHAKHAMKTFPKWKKSRWPQCSKG